MCSSCKNSDLHIGKRRACEHPPVLLFLNVCGYEALPVFVEHILTAGGCNRDSAATLRRRQKQMHLCIVAQRLKVSYSLDSPCYRFLIYNAARSESDNNTKPVLYETHKHLHLHLSHELHIDFLKVLHPHYVKLWVFLLKLL